MSEASAVQLLEAREAHEAAAVAAHGRREDVDEDFRRASGNSDRAVRLEACRLALAVSNNHVDVRAAPTGPP